MSKQGCTITGNTEVAIELQKRFPNVKESKDALIRIFTEHLDSNMTREERMAYLDTLRAYYLTIVDSLIHNGTLDPSLEELVKAEINNSIKYIKRGVTMYCNSLSGSFVYDENKVLHTLNRSSFIPVIRDRKLNASLYSKAVSDIKDIFSGISLMPEKSSNLGDKVKGYVEKKLKELYFYINSLGTFNLATYLNNNDAYKALLNDVETKVYNTFNTPKGSPISIAKTVANNHHLNTLLTVYTLNRLDDLITACCGDYVYIQSHHNMMYFESDKYKLKQKGNTNKGYDKEANKADAKNANSKLFFDKWSSWGYEKSDFYYIAKEINKAYNSDLSEDTIEKDLDYNYIIGWLSKSPQYSDIVYMLQNWREEYETAQKNTNYYKARIILDHYLSFTKALEHLVKTHLNTAYVLVEADKGIEVKDPLIFLKSKMPIKKNLINTAKRDIDEKIGNINLSYYLSRIRPLPIDSKEFIDYFTSITGIHLKSERVKELNSYRDLDNADFMHWLIDKELLDEDVVINDNKILNGTDVVKLFLDQYIKAIDSYKATHYNTNALEKVLDKQIFSTKLFANFSNFMLRDNVASLVRVTDQSNNEQPSVVLPNNFQRIKEAIKDNPALTDKNVFKGHPEWFMKTRGRYLNKHTLISYRQDVCFKYKTSKGEKEVVKKATDLTKQETAVYAFNYEFIDSACKNETIFILPVCFADKVKLGLVGVNSYALARTATLNSLKQSLIPEQRHSYYLSLAKSIIASYRSAGILQIDDNFHNLVAKNIHKLREGIDYVKDAKGRYTQNYVLAKFIQESNMFNENQTSASIIASFFGSSNNDTVQLIENYIQEGVEEFKKIAETIYIPSFMKNKEYLDTYKEPLSSLFELTSNEEYDLFKSIILDKNILTWADFDKKATEKKLGISIVEKFCYLNSYISEGFTLLFGGNYASTTNKSLNIDDNTVVDELYFRKAMHKNIVGDTKRHNFYSATFIPPLTNLKYGVRERSKYLVVKDPVQIIKNYAGNEHTQEVIDGGMLSLGIQTEWEKNSYPGFDYADTMKGIGLMPTAYTQRQLKYALFSLNNEMIRNAFIAKDDPTVWRVGDIARIMMRSGKFYDFVYNYNSPNNKLIYDEDIFIKKPVEARKQDEVTIYSNIIYKFEDLKIDSQGNATTTWINTLSKKAPELKITKKLNTVEDLWEIFGGAYSMSKNSDGEYYYSEKSMEMVANLISEFEPVIKERMFVKIVPVAVFKKGVEQVHTIEQLYSGQDLRPIYWDNQYMGIQQDYGHDADDSEITSLTLLINNVSFNGENVELVNQIWETLSYLIDQSLSKYKLNNKTSFREYGKKVAEFMIKKTDSTSSSNDLILLLEQAQETGLLPFSDLSVFSKFASDLIVQLNRVSIRRTSRGIAIIQNPSHGLIGVFEDADGEIYRANDVIKLKLTQPEKYKAKFEPKNVNVNDLAIEDIVYIWKDGKKERKRILNIDDLLYVEKESQKEGVIIQKAHEMRNLKSPQVTYRILTEEGLVVKKSFWLSECVKKRWEAEKNYKLNPTIDNKIRYLFTKEWYLENLKALDKGEFYETEELFITGKPVKIIDYKYTPGELILPKTFKTVYGLSENETLQDVLQRGASFFDAHFEELFTLPDIRDLTIYDEAVVIKHDNYNVIYTVLKYNESLKGNIKVNPRNTIIENDVVWFCIDGVKQFILPDLKPSALISSTSDIIYDRRTKSYIINCSNIDDLRKNDPDIFKGAFYVKEREITRPPKDHDKVLNHFNSFLQNLIWTLTGLLDYSILSLKKYQSFLRTLDTISVRIPTQAFQSFMRNRTVAFTDYDTNDGYINLMQIWFTGGDYDIDKSYTLMYDVDNNGIIATTSKLADFSDETLLNASFDLPLPDNNFLIRKAVIIEGKLSEKDEDFIKTALDYVSSDKLQRLLMLKNILTNVRLYNYTNPKVNDKNLLQAVLKLINDINTHNDTTITSKGLLNRITNGLIRCSGDIKNLHASQQPMDSGPMNEQIDEAEALLGEETETLNPYNPMYKWDLQEKALVGKNNTGIAANGVKVDSSIQQYFNTAYQKWEVNSYLDPKYKVNAPINIVVNGRPIIQKNIVRFGDTVLDKDSDKARYKFHRLYDVIEDSLLEQEKDFILINGYLNDNSLYEKVETSRDRETLALFKYMYPDILTLTRDIYLDFLFRKEKFSPRVSDSLSIFISLAVDNMKEMKLSRLYCTEDVLKLPLSLIMLGVDPFDVILFCKTVLKPLVNALHCDRFRESKPDIELIITKLINTKAENAIFSTDLNENKNIANLLLTILQIANQNEVLAKFFKVNLGVPATFITMTLNLIELARQLKNVISNNVYGYKKPLDLQELFLYQNPELINDLQAIAAKTNKGYNIVDLLLSSKHFFNMHKAWQAQEEIIRSSASRAFSQKILLKLALRRNDYISEDTLRRITKLYDHFIIGETLASLPLLSFSNNSLKHLLAQDILNLRNDEELKLLSNKELEVFVRLMNEVIIPKLKLQYPNNYAIKALTPTTVYGSSDVFYDLPFNIFEKDYVEDLYNISVAKQEFFDIADNPSGLITVNGEVISIVDALNLYQMIIKKDVRSALKEVVTDSSNKNSVINNKKYELINYYDEAVYNHYISNGKLELPESLLKLLNNEGLYLSALSPNLKGAYNLKNSLIWTFTLPTTQIPIKQLIPTIQKVYPGVNVTFDLDTNILYIEDYKYAIDYSLGLNFIGFDLIQEGLNSYQRYLKNKQLWKEHIVESNIPISDVLEEDAKYLDVIKSFVEFNKILVNEFALLHHVSYLKQPKAYVTSKEGLVCLNVKSDQVTPLNILEALLMYYADNNLQNQLKYLETFCKAQGIKVKKGLINDYLDYYYENNSTRLDIQGAQLFLEDSNEYLKNSNLYYKETAQKSLKDLNIGDVLIENKNTYIYMGRYKTDYRFININTGELKAKPNIQENTLFNIKDLKVNFGYKFSKTSMHVPNLTKWSVLAKPENTDIPVFTFLKDKNSVYKVVHVEGDTLILLKSDHTFISVDKKKLKNIQYAFVDHSNNFLNFKVKCNNLSNVRRYTDTLKAEDVIYKNNDDNPYSVISVNNNNTIKVIGKYGIQDISILDIDTIEYKTFADYSKLLYNPYLYKSYFTRLYNMPSSFVEGDYIVRDGEAMKIILTHPEVVICNNNTIEVYKYDPLDIYYTKNNDLILKNYSAGSVNIKPNVNDSTVTREFINNLLSLGIKVVIDSNPNMIENARFEGDTIFINLRFINDPNEILHFTAHEFMHIALAHVKLNSPTTYLKLIHYMKNNLEVFGEIPTGKLADGRDILLKDEFAYIDSLSAYYENELDILEEKLIRYLDAVNANKLGNLIADNSNKKNTNILKDFLAITKKQLGITGNNNTLFDRIDERVFNLDTFDLEKIHANKVTNEILNNIQIKC